MSDHRQRRVNRVRVVPTLAVTACLAVAATAATVSVGVLSGGADPADTSPRVTQAAAAARPERPVDVSRDLTRSAVAPSDDLAPKAAHVAREKAQDRARRVREQRATTRAVAQADSKLWATADLDVWTAAKGGDQRGLLDDGDRVLVTGRTQDGRAEVVVRGESRWVTSRYLSEDKPLGEGAGLSMDPCPDGGVESGLTSGAVHVYRSVCNAFPQITSYGGWDGHGEHSSGRALDIMTSDVALGTAIADFLQAHASELGLYDVIWRQRIWTPVRASEGWRSMSSRGSATANHYDHVHVAVN